MSDKTSPLAVIDFHNHHVPKRYRLTAALTQPSTQRARWEQLAIKLPDEDLLLHDIREGHLRARVVNIPGNLIADADGLLPYDTYKIMNDDIADLAARNPGRIHGLASVDGYDGERSAREAERAIKELGLRGLFVDCARGDVLIDAPQVRPVLEVAARLGVPVFAHPVAPQPLTRQMTPYGIIGTLFARGAINSAALIALVEGGVFSELPRLRVVFTAQAIGGLAMATGLSQQSRLPSGAIEVVRKHVYIDTTLVHPAIIRALSDMLGPENILAGSDWPIAGEKPLQPALMQAMRDASLTAVQQSAIASKNCERLLALN